MSQRLSTCVIILIYLINEFLTLAVKNILVAIVIITKNFLSISSVFVYTKILSPNVGYTVKESNTIKIFYLCYFSFYSYK